MCAILKWMIYKVKMIGMSKRSEIYSAIRINIYSRLSRYVCCYTLGVVSPIEYEQRYDKQRCPLFVGKGTL